MTSRDKHLQQALKHAPDSDLLPSDAVRKKVIDHAHAISPSKQAGWLKRWFSNLSNVQLVGISTFASALVVMFMVLPQLPNEKVWTDADVQDIALQEPPAPPPIEAPESAPLLPEEEAVAAPAEDSLAAASEEVVEMKTQAPVVKKLERRKRDAVKPKEQKPLADKPVVAKAAESVSIAENEDVEVKVAQESLESDIADLEQPKTELAQQEVAGAQPSSSPMAARRSAAAPQADASIETLAKSRADASNIPLSGMAIAKSDIAAGNLRILFAGDDWPDNQPMVDEETGFRVELTTMTASETDAYNQEMRAWYRAKQAE